MKIIFDIIRTM